LKRIRNGWQLRQTCYLILNCRQEESSSFY
jgi:hypothetical protein